MNLKEEIRNIPDYPKPGIMFRDITPLLLNPKAFAFAIKEMSSPFQNAGINYVAGAEARGFIFGAPIAQALGIGFIPIRKPNKLPGDTIKYKYDLEYGTDALEIHTGQFSKGSKILLVDDLLATGGTIEAASRLIAQEGGIVAGFSFLIELSFLQGRKKLADNTVHSLLFYDSED